MLVAQELQVCPFCEEMSPGPVCRSCGTFLEGTDESYPAQPPSPDGSLCCPYCDVELPPDAAVCHSCGSLLNE